MGMYTGEDLKRMQALPLWEKVGIAQARIIEYYQKLDGKVHVSFSGGKDSTVLAYLVHNIFPDVPLVFVNTGLEYPEIQAFAKKMGAEFIRPKMRFDEVISKYGYPLIGKETAEAIYYARRINNGQNCKSGKDKTSKWTKTELLGIREIPKEKENTGVWKDWRRNAITGKGECSGNSMFNKRKWLPLATDVPALIGHRCCGTMKKEPIHEYEKRNGTKPMTGQMADESLRRKQSWLKNGCNAFGDRTISNPLSVWTEQDVLKFIKANGIEIASVYGDIVAVDKNGHQYEPMVLDGCKLQCTGCQRTGCIFCAFGAHLEKGETRFQRLAKTHPKQYEYCMGGWSMGG